MKLPYPRYLLTVVLLISSLIPSVSMADTQSGINHIVLCWLHEPGLPDQIQQVIDTSKELKIIPGVVDIQAGKSVPSERSIVDDSFDAGVVMTFRTVSDLNKYLVHDEHVKRVNKILRPLCKRILVYDIAY